MSHCLFGIPIEEVSAVFEDCYLVFKGPDGQVLDAFNLCGAEIGGGAGSAVTLTSATGKRKVISEKSWALLGLSVNDVFNEIKACKVSPATIENAELNVLKFGTTKTRFCFDDANGEPRILEYTECIREAPGGTLTTTYMTPGGEMTLTQLMAAGFELWEEAATSEEYSSAYHEDDMKFTEEVQIVMVDNEKTGEEEWFLAEEYEQGIRNPLDKSKYTLMSNVASRPSEVKIEGIEKLDFVFCPDGGLAAGTLADLLAAAVAEGAIVDGVAPDAIAGYDLKALWNKQQLGSKVTSATGFTLGGDDDHYTNGGGVCQLPKPVDADCDGAADAVIEGSLALDRPFAVVDGAGVQVCLWFYKADADSSDPSVQ